jgi:2-polyprenyl-3-methyl-5-hydroxy-6-metoxy-1,4-benzoquinol methylase
MKDKKDFDKEAAVWDAKPMRVKLALDVAEAIIREIKPTQDLTVMDFGCGTGLVTLRLAPRGASGQGAATRADERKHPVS